MTSEEIIARQGEIEERRAQISAELEQPEADLDVLEEDQHHEHHECSCGGHCGGHHHG